jgi:hypothetical protein
MSSGDCVRLTMTAARSPDGTFTLERFSKLQVRPLGSQNAISRRINWWAGHRHHDVAIVERYPIPPGKSNTSATRMK